MQCPECKLEIPLLLDGALGPAEEAALTAHLESCPACALELEKAQCFHSFLRKRLRPEPAPADLRRQIMADMRASRPGSKWRLPAVCTAAVAAAAALVLVVSGAELGGGKIPGTIRTAMARQSDDRLPLDVQSANEAELQTFFASHLPFDLAVPRISAHSHVRGGRLTYLGEQPSAFISYEINGSKASLYVFTDPQSAQFAQKDDSSCKVVKEVDNERQAVIWHRGNVVYSLVGGQADSFMSDFVKEGCGN